MLTIRTATCAAYEQFRPLRRNGKSCCCHSRGCDEDKMPKDTVREEGITPDCNRETDSPHKPECLQDVMPDSNIWDVAKWADVVVEHERPRLSHKGF